VLRWLARFFPSEALVFGKGWDKPVPFASHLIGLDEARSLKDADRVCHVEFEEREDVEFQVPWLALEPAEAVAVPPEASKDQHDVCAVLCCKVLQTFVPEKLRLYRPNPRH